MEILYKNQHKIVNKHQVVFTCVRDVFNIGANDQFLKFQEKRIFKLNSSASTH